MRNDTANWKKPADTLQQLKTGSLHVREVVGIRQTMVSVPAPQKEALSGGLPLIGWPEIAPETDYALSLRRDRVLRIGGPVLQDGWNCDARLAVSEMTTGLAVFDISGADAPALLKRGAALDVRNSSASCAWLFAGFDILICQYQTTGTFRVHVARGLSHAFFETLSAFADQLSDAPAPA